jgi:hypothetical protein
MAETPAERILRLLRAETGSTEFVQPWRLHRNREEKFSYLVAVVDRRTFAATIPDAATEEEALARVREVAPHLTPVIEET